MTGIKHKEMLCSADVDDPFMMRPPLWEDITSSIQNIDPENAIMLGTIATQVKLETSDEQLLEPLSSPLLSPLEIKTEKSHQHHQQQNHHHLNGHHHHHHLNGTSAILQHNTSNLNQNNNSNSSSNNNNTNNNNNNNANNNNNSYHLNGSANYQQQQQQPHLSSLNGYLGGTNGSGNMSLHHSQQHHNMLNGNTSYYNNNWQQHSQVGLHANSNSYLNTKKRIKLNNFILIFYYPPMHSKLYVFLKKIPKSTIPTVDLFCLYLLGSSVIVRAHLFLLLLHNLLYNRDGAIDYLKNREKNVNLN